MKEGSFQLPNRLRGRNIHIKVITELVKKDSLNILLKTPYLKKLILLKPFGKSVKGTGFI